MTLPFSEETLPQKGKVESNIERPNVELWPPYAGTSVYAFVKRCCRGNSLSVESLARMDKALGYGRGCLMGWLVDEMWNTG